MKVMEPTVEKTPPLTGAQWRQLIGLTVAALVVFAVFRWLPTGTNLSHGDFRLEGDNVLEFCDPSAPQFLPVTTARSPVSFDVTPAMATAGQPTTFTLRLATSSGKQIGPVDLMVAHTRKLHVMAVDPTLTDYLHVHPEPTETPGSGRLPLPPIRPARIGYSQISPRRRPRAGFMRVRISKWMGVPVTIERRRRTDFDMSFDSSRRYCGRGNRST